MYYHILVFGSADTHLNIVAEYVWQYVFFLHFEKLFVVYDARWPQQLDIAGKTLRLLVKNKAIIVECHFWTFGFWATR